MSCLNQLAGESKMRFTLAIDGQVLLAANHSGWHKVCADGVDVGDTALRLYISNVTSETLSWTFMAL